ncbi:MAG: HTH domain-containing protein [Candidatus Rokubacteria bacterium]|nr:HTH domain-containing protein [Candidatus Rokubacteria bacterium]
MGESNGTRTNWWHDLDDEIVRSVDARGIVSAAEIAQKLGVSERAAASFLALLALDGKVRIRVVEAVRGAERG